MRIFERDVLEVLRQSNFAVKADEANHCLNSRRGDVLSGDPVVLRASRTALELLHRLTSARNRTQYQVFLHGPGIKPR